jgi:hypothetical protein
MGRSGVGIGESCEEKGGLITSIDIGTQFFITPLHASLASPQVLRQSCSLQYQWPSRKG